MGSPRRTLPRDNRDTGPCQNLLQSSIAEYDRFGNIADCRKVEIFDGFRWPAVRLRSNPDGCPFGGRRAWSLSPVGVDGGRARHPRPRREPVPVPVRSLSACVPAEPLIRSSRPVLTSAHLADVPAVQPRLDRGDVVRDTIQAAGELLPTTGSVSFHVSTWLRVSSQMRSGCACAVHILFTFSHFSQYDFRRSPLGIEGSSEPSKLSRFGLNQAGEGLDPLVPAE